MLAAMDAVKKGTTSVNKAMEELCMGLKQYLNDEEERALAGSFN